MGEAKRKNEIKRRHAMWEEYYDRGKLSARADINDQCYNSFRAEIYAGLYFDGPIKSKNDKKHSEILKYLNAAFMAGYESLGERYYGSFNES